MVDRFLQTLTPAELEALEEAASIAHYEAGSAIFRQGDVADRVAVVRFGSVRIVAAGPDGEEVLLAERGAGELLGDLSGIDGQPRSASVVAQDDVECLEVPLRAFRAFLMDHPRAAISLLELVSRRLRESDAARVSNRWR